MVIEQGNTMRGRQTKLSPARNLTAQAARVAPAVAIAGALLGMPSHTQPPPRTVPVELDASVLPEPSAGTLPEPSAGTVHASPARVYVIQAGDTLWSIAQRFYGSGLMWPHIYHANQPQIADPNDIYAGQKLIIPHVGTSSATTSTASANASPAPASPPAYYIAAAAKATGLPVSVVGAQCYVESADGQDMGPSSAGAMGPWQFEPGTWADCSPAPFDEATNWAVSTQAYITLMSQLLHWSGGNIQMALAAYNAGQGNWQAGLGYANQILSMAG